MTFLLTDIEGSTTRWEHEPEAMRVALARHDALLRGVIQDHGGYVVKMTGDGLHAAFVHTLDAVIAALDAQRLLRDEPWTKIDPIRARMAIHTGEAEERDGDYFGPPLNRVARLLSAGYGGQVLLSKTSADLVVDVLPPETTLVDLGEHRLKDLIQPERIFQVTASDLQSDFAPLVTLDDRPHNLPVQPTPMIGREREVRAVYDLLVRDDVRLVTLTGPGGTGKTRVGLQVAAELVDVLQHGATFVGLDPISDPALVVPTIARAVGIRNLSSRSVQDELVAYLRDRCVLLVLDNFEHVLPAASAVADLLAACHRLKILVTSRAVLHLRGEHEFQVPPLDVPELGRSLSPHELGGYSAVALFAYRAKGVQPDFGLTDENALAVATICRRLDGLPLAIELGAARIKLLSPQTMLARLERRLPLLTGGSRDSPARQRTLRTAIAWSYDLLDEAERRLFHRIAVFVGGCTLQAAETVCTAGEDLEVAVLDGVASLVDKSLLRRELVDGEPRLLMLETIREYAMEKLEASGEAGVVRRRHADYILSLAEVAAGNLRGPEQMTWLRSLEREQDNLRTALAWSMAMGEGQLMLQLAGTLHWFWMLRLPREGREWLDRALALGEAQGMQQTPEWIAALLAQSDLAWAARDPDLSLLLERGAAACAVVGDARGTAWFQHLSGERASVFGDLARAPRLLAASVAGFRTHGDIWDVARALIDLADVVGRRGDYAHAQALLTECLALFRKVGDRWGMTQAHAALALHMTFEGECERAAQHAEAGLAPARELSDVGSMARLMSLLGWLAHLLGDGDTAHERIQEAITLGRDTGNQYTVARVFSILGERCRARQRYAWAAVLYEHGLALFREIGADAGVSLGQLNLGLASLRLGDPQRATVLLRESLVGGVDRYISPALAGMAGVALAYGRPERAATLLAMASTHLDSRGAALEQTDQMEYDHGLIEARAHLDDVAFDIAWETGRAMSTAAAIAYALERSDVSSV